MKFFAISAIISASEPEEIVDNVNSLNLSEVVLLLTEPFGIFFTILSVTNFSLGSFTVFISNLKSSLYLDITIHTLVLRVVANLGSLVKSLFSLAPLLFSLPNTFDINLLSTVVFLFIADPISFIAPASAPNDAPIINPAPVIARDFFPKPDAGPS